MSISVGAYDPATHTVPLTVTGGGSGELLVLEAAAPGDFRVQRVVARIPYSGGPTVVTDRMPANGSRTYRAFVDDTPNGVATVTLATQGDWVVSLSDPDTTRRVCIVAGSQRWRSRRRRGWWGNVVGQVRAVAVTDVSMGSREGQVSLLVAGDQVAGVDQLLRQGIVCFRGIDPTGGNLFAMLLDYTDRPAGDGNAWWTFDITLVQVEPAGWLAVNPSWVP